MSGWHAIVPLKSPQDRKSRLGLAHADRLALTDRMVAHVLQTLTAVPEIGTVTILSPEPWPDHHWLPDTGRGLNVELTLARALWLDRAVLIVHGDLPEVREDDIRQLIAAAANGVVAIATDRHGSGTNAIALPRGVALEFAFGPGSLQAHLNAAPGARVVRARGLAHDIDTPADLAAARIA